MKNKFVMLGMAVAVIAVFAVPAKASALELRDSSGKVAVGSEIELFNTFARITNTALGTIRCSFWTFRTEVVSNGPSKVQEVGAWFGSGETFACEAEGEPVTMTSPEITQRVTTGGDFGTAGFGMTADVGPFECPYGGSGSFSYFTGAGADTMSIFTITFSSPFEFCEPESGSPMFEGEFTMRTANNFDPVYFQ